MIINSTEHLNKARSLLHHCYLEHLEWEIDKSNPSGIKVQDIGPETIISDDYDNLAIWFSVINQNECIACGRICHNDANGLLELERYANAREALQDVLQEKQKLSIVEFNREAVLPQYAEDEKPYLLLLKLAFQYCLQRNYAILTTSNLSEWVEVYDKIGFKRLKTIFKYFDSETDPVVVYFATTRDITNIIKKINLALIEY